MRSTGACSFETEPLARGWTQGASGVFLCATSMVAAIFPEGARGARQKATAGEAGMNL
jgi:hypothetical protein